MNAVPPLPTPLWVNTVENLIEHHYAEYPTASPPVLERLSNGDWSLTRGASDGTVTFIDIIDKDTGEFVSTARLGEAYIQPIIDKYQGTLDILAER